jgi:hypothetical protein
MLLLRQRLTQLLLAHLVLEQIPAVLTMEHQDLLLFLEREQ